MLYTLLDHSVTEIAVKEAIGNDSIIFLDARSLAEYNVSHIKDAIHVGYDNFSFESVPSDAKDKPIVVYCSVGYRSEKIAEKLNENGYKNVSNLYGGIFEWVNQGNPVYQGDTTTQNVHAYDKTWGIWLNKGHKVYNEE